jgi:hypothetical protein
MARQIGSARLWLLAAGGFLAFAPSVIAEDPMSRIQEAHDEYEKAMERIDSEALSRMDELIAKYSDDGNLRKVLEVRAQKARLMEERAWPESVAFRSTRERIRSARLRASRELENAYEDAIAELTKEKNYDDAVILRDELDELLQIQKECDFQKSDDAQASQETNTDEDATEVVDRDAKRPRKPARKPASDRVVRGKKTAADAKSPLDLAAALAAEAAKTRLSDPLATSKEKADALLSITKALYMKLPPRLWTAKQCDDFAEWFSNSTNGADHCFLPEVAPVAGTGPWLLATNAGPRSISGPPDGLRRFCLSRPRMQWLVSSPTSEEFIARANHLQTNESWPDIDRELDLDSLKLWLKSIGCADLASSRKMVDALVEGGVQATAVQQLHAQINK